MHRRKTGESGNDRSLRRRITQPFSAQAEEKDALPQRHQGRYGVYNGLTWDKLKGFLESKFPASVYPGLTFNETRVDDYWVFETPEPLTGEDKKELLILRDQYRSLRSSVTPE